MKDYYFEKMNKAQLAVDLADVGYRSRLLRLAGELSNCDSAAVGAIVDELNRLREVFEDLVSDVEHYRAKYQEELDKESEPNEEG